jgi:NAD(P)-dependent dehydrogenase (short-subunit alcohol dehydrogenase family)
MDNINGKVGIITGGTSGFGLAMTEALLAKGARVSVFSVDDLSSDLVQAMLKKHRDNLIINNADITDKASAEFMVERTIEKFGTINFIIANAGFAIRFEKPFPSLTVDFLYESMEKEFQVFPIAFASLALAASKYMIEEYEDAKRDANGHLLESGSIIVTLSEAALCPLRDDLLAYAAAKKASLSIMQSLSGILGPKNIRVNGIAPGFANTAGPQKFYSRYPHIKTYVDSRIYLKPAFMSSEAVVPAIEYLLNDNYVTGQVIALDGGFSNEIQNYFE